MRHKIIKRILIAAIILSMLGGLGYVAVRMLAGPADGVVVNAEPTTNVITKTSVELEQFEGTAFTFAYPTSYTPQPPAKDDPNSLETHTFVASSLMNKILTVTVTKLPSGKLEDNPSYFMRTLHPDVYQLKPQTIQGEKVIVALNLQDSQEAAFWVHSGKLLTFTLSSVSINSQETAAEYQKMLESIRWR